MKGSGISRVHDIFKYAAGTMTRVMPDILDMLRQMSSVQPGPGRKTVHSLHRNATKRRRVYDLRGTKGREQECARRRRQMGK